MGVRSQIHFDTNGQNLEKCCLRPDKEFTSSFLRQDQGHGLWDPAVGAQNPVSPVTSGDSLNSVCWFPHL